MFTASPLECCEMGRLTRDLVDNGEHMRLGQIGRLEHGPGSHNTKNLQSILFNNEPDYT